MKWKIAGAAAVVVVLGLLVAGLAVRASITGSLGDIADRARAAAPAAGDDVEALMIWVADEDRPIEERNRGVWALGQLRDPRALPVLRKFVVASCDHGNDICQHELAKAIALCEGHGPDLLGIRRSRDG